MPDWVKALIIVAIIVVGLVAGLENRRRRRMRNQAISASRAKEVVAEGKEFGRNHDNQACVDEAISRYKKYPGLNSANSNDFFLPSCLDASKPTAGFCDTVPKEFIGSLEWQLDQCRRVGLSGEIYCRQLFQPVQQFCESGARKATPGKNANSE